MATAKLEKVERDFRTCAICLEHYTDPITLDCQHSFCRKCISDYIKTQPEARKKKLIPCPCCSQMSRVPDLTRPVEGWAGQLKLGFVIQGLIDALTTEDVPQEESATTPCTLCQQLGETTPGVLWCPDCEVSLCDRCIKMHRIQPISRDHKLLNLEEKGSRKKRRKVMCKEHTDEEIKFYCEDCDKALCHLCSVVYHRKCESVVTIKSMMPKIKTDIAEHRRRLSEKVNLMGNLTKSRQGSITHLQKEKPSIQEEIRNAGQRAIKHIKLKERQLMDELNVGTNTQVVQLKSDIKKGDIEKNMYRQYGEYIDQALTSDCEMDIYDLFQTWKSGCLGIMQDSDTSPAEKQVSLVKFKGNYHKIDMILGELSLGEILCSIGDTMLASVLYSTTDGRTDNMLSDEEIPLIFDDEEELGLTPEEAQIRQEEHRQYDEDLRRDKAARKLQSFFKMLTFKGRLESGSFLRICKVQEVKKLFVPFEVTEKMCGVCGVWFQSDELAIKDLTEEEVYVSRSPNLLMDAAMQISSPAAKSVWNRRSPISAHLESHIHTRKHIQMKLLFETFRRLHDDYFVQKVPEMRKFITRLQLRDPDFTSEHYPDQALNVSRLTSQMDELLAVYEAILSERHWAQTSTLRETVVRLYDDYTRVGPEIIASYKEYVEQPRDRPRRGGGRRRPRVENKDRVFDEERDFDRARRLGQGRERRRGRGFGRGRESGGFGDPRW